MRMTPSLITLFSVAIALTSGAAVQAKTDLQVYTASPAGFEVNSTLLTGGKDAILIDAQFTLADAHRLAAMILESKKNLTTVYVTHAHPDHYFGLQVIKQTFPKAKIVALPATVAEIKKTGAAKVAQWKPMYGDGITSTPVVPEALKGTSVSLEGETLEVAGGLQGDSSNSSYVWVPSLKAVVAGDIVYGGVHPWTAETDATGRRAWEASVDKLNALGPTVVVPGHQKPDSKRDAGTLKFTKDYLTYFDEARAACKTAEELQSKVKAKYSDLDLDVILTLGSEAAFKTAAK
jgi:glyoxylase-like metal-dependent hydrolase (beta-lactamase superfamily II)